ncbi:hypothetical protein BVX93_02375 [bacterium B13(2017)]|nr:hypothetical protein BVX93_02375 [bacterium B13(2017)]
MRQILYFIIIVHIIIAPLNTTSAFNNIAPKSINKDPLKKFLAENNLLTLWKNNAFFMKEPSLYPETNDELIIYLKSLNGIIPAYNGDKIFLVYIDEKKVKNTNFSLKNINIYNRSEIDWVTLEDRKIFFKLQVVSISIMAFAAILFTLSFGQYTGILFPVRSIVHVEQVIPETSALILIGVSIALWLFSLYIASIEFIEKYFKNISQKKRKQKQNKRRLTIYKRLGFFTSHVITNGKYRLQKKSS